MLDLSQYPKILKTKEDYLFVRKNFPDKYWIEDFLNLEIDAKEEIVVGILKNESGKFTILKKLDLDTKDDQENSEILTRLFNETEHYLVSCKGDFEEEPEWSIYEVNNRFFATISVEKESSKMKDLGFTMEELENLLKIDLGGIEDDGRDGSSDSGTES